MALGERDPRIRMLALMGADGGEFSWPLRGHIHPDVGDKWATYARRKIGVAGPHAWRFPHPRHQAWQHALNNGGGSRVIGKKIISPMGNQEIWSEAMQNVADPLARLASTPRTASSSAAI